MRAAIVERQGPVESRPLKLVDMPIPDPGENEVLIRVLACGVCRTDLHVTEGDLPLRLRPVIPGHQIVAPSKVPVNASVSPGFTARTVLAAFA